MSSSTSVNYQYGWSANWGTSNGIGLEIIGSEGDANSDALTLAVIKAVHDVLAASGASYVADEASGFRSVQTSVTTNSDFSGSTPAWD